MNVAFVIPTYNEAANIQKLIPQIAKVMHDTVTHTTYKIIIVDDESPDGTGRIVDVLAKKYPVYVIHRKIRNGLGEAYKTGLKYGLRTADLIFSMDADLSHNPKRIPAMIAAAKHADVVIGSRYISGGGVVNWPWHRKLLSKGANTLAAMILGLNAHDCTSGYRCYRKKVLTSIDLNSIHSNGYSFLEDILYRCVRKEFKLAEIPIVFKDRVRGVSKLSKKELWRFFLTLLRLRLGLKT
ncbi:MAG: polyprenol monophosphomannose synthase [archaeon]